MTTEMMPPDLVVLLEKARGWIPTPEELEAQRRSFAYGNAKMEDPSVTMEQVDAAAERLRARSS